MTLRTKTLSIVILTLISLLAVLYVSTTTIVMGGFAGIEDQDTRKNVHRALDAYADEIAKLNTTAGDWASWDATYAFIENVNQQYIDENINAPTASRLGLSVLAYIRSSGQLVIGAGFDPYTARSMPLPKSLPAHFIPGDPLLQYADLKAGTTGLMLLPEGPLLVAARPILTSGGDGPSRGTLVMGRYLDTQLLAQLAQRTHVELAIQRLDSPSASPDFDAARAALLQGAAATIAPLSQNTIAGYSLVRDIYGRPALLLRVELPRTIYEQGRVSAQYQLLSLLVVGVVFGSVTLVLLEKLVLARLARLSAEVSCISASGDLSARASVSGRDELARFAAEVNRMLGALERAQAERQETEAALYRAKEAAEAASRAKSAFLANMSHELRTPLTSIIGYSELLEEEARLVGHADMVSDLDRIRFAGKHLLALINDILDLSKIEAGKMQLEPESFEIRFLLQNVIATVRPLAEKNSNLLKLFCAADIGTMHADLTKVRQILLNLLSNAAKFTKQGTITVQVARHRSEGAEQIVFRISDTGIGISAEQQAVLFQEFMQATTIITRTYGGTGLGLALSHRFCQLMGGTLSVTSQPGLGSTFTVRLPAAASGSAADPALPEEHSPRLTAFAALPVAAEGTEHHAGDRQHLKRITVGG